MSIDYSQLPLSKGTPGPIARRQRRAEKDKKLEEAYAEVDLRDGGFCHVTGWYTQPGAIDHRARREHHHIQSRSTYPERIYDVTNIITTCALAHWLIENGKIVVEGVSTLQPVRFHWAAHVPQSERVIKIRSRRWSQDES